MTTRELPTRDHPLLAAEPAAPAGSARTAPRWLRTVWAGPGRGLLAASAVVVPYALVAGWWTPRGPVSTLQALTTLAVSLVVGGLAGLLLRSRWAMLLAPVVFVGVFELARWRAVGPTVDGLHLGSFYGLVAAGAGRGFHGLLTLVPLALAAALGASRARRLQGHRVAPTGRLGSLARYTRRGVASLVAVGLVLLGVALARPASTEPIVGADGQPLPGSVAELTRVSIGDHDLAMMIRGTDVTNPVLLFLAGGPGGSELGAMRHHGEALERDFVVVTLDQRGTGRSYDQLEPTSTLTVQGAVDDAVGVARYLTERFDQDTVYLVGQSWGTLLGVLAAQAHPELFAAFVGVGQMVSPRETDRIFYEDTLAWATSTGRSAVVETLEAIGPPPYEDLLRYPTLLGYEQDVYAYDHSGNAEGAGQMLEGLPVGEYSVLDTVNVARGLLDTFGLMYPQLQEIDFRADVPALDVPVYLVQGRFEADGRAEPASEWFDVLQAPSKQWIEFDTSGHRPLFEQPERFAEVMSRTVLSATESAS